ncbi:hypothetical protein [Chryseobacterium daeguense]|uniref:hypothetical protein n=1 Tax=Chryseobacterium daeguense TaxID=412438 RepID=UPI0003F7DA46|nr:hypothetical protein [Chryseobacterium daeguense]
MNKSFQDIINEMLGAKEGNSDLSGLTSTSKTAVWLQILQTVAFIIFNFQEACRLFLKEIEDKIASQKIPNLMWYRGLALKFQYGFDLLPESDQFSTSFEDNGVIVEATPEQIEASKIIKYCAVTRNKGTDGRIKISMKIAGQNVDEILEDEKALAFKDYIEEVQAAGDDIVIVNFLPDILKLEIKIAIDSLILNNNGMSIITGKYPVQETIQRFLLNTPFNGELSVQSLREAIKATEGVKDLQELNVQSKWIDPTVGGYGMLQPITISKIPRSGRFKIEDWSGITYFNYTPQQ